MTQQPDDRLAKLAFLLTLIVLAVGLLFSHRRRAWPLDTPTPLPATVAPSPAAPPGAAILLDGREPWDWPRSCEQGCHDRWAE